MDPVSALVSPMRAQSHFATSDHHGRSLQLMTSGGRAACLDGLHGARNGPGDDTAAKYLLHGFREHRLVRLLDKLVVSVNDALASAFTFALVGFGILGFRIDRLEPS